MSCDTPTATNEMMAFIATALAAFPGLVVKYDGVDKMDPPDATKDWTAAHIKHDDSGQGSLCGPIQGRTRWRRHGQIAVQCFAQLAPTGAAPGDRIGKDKAMIYACAVRDAFQGRATDGGVWFRNCNAKEVGPDKSWYQANATITFEYDEVK